VLANEVMPLGRSLPARTTSKLRRSFRRRTASHSDDEAKEPRCEGDLSKSCFGVAVVSLVSEFVRSPEPPKESGKDAIRL
jgi:hypothetical protein